MCGCLVLDRVVDGGLQTVLVDDEVCFLQRDDGLGGELHVMRLGTRLSEAGQLDAVTSDLLDEELLRVEADDDRGPARS
ncbi:hypothetical protein GCM10027298_29610 [Epidermidibacterium keratini]